MRIMYLKSFRLFLPCVSDKSYFTTDRLVCFSFIYIGKLENSARIVHPLISSPLYNIIIVTFVYSNKNMIGFNQFSLNYHNSI